MTSRDGRSRVAHDLRRYLPSARWTESATHGIELSTGNAIGLLEQLRCPGFRAETFAQAQAHLDACARLDAELEQIPRWRWHKRRQTRARRELYTLMADRLLRLVGA